MLTYLLFLVGFVLLIKGADILVIGASAIARYYHISDIVIGLTIVSFGTSLPELIVSVVSAFKGSADLAIGNVLGSNVANILLILGVSALFYSLPIKENTMLIEIPFSLTAVLLLGFLANAALLADTPQLMLSRIDGLLLLFFFSLFMAYIYRLALQDSVPEEIDTSERPLTLRNAGLYVLGGVIGLFLGGQWVVNGAVKIATAFGVSQSLIGLTIVAVGTSLPELVTSAMAAYRKNTDIAVGNVIGSNIFNILWILGLSSLIRPLAFDVLNNTDILMVIFASTLLLLGLAVGKKYTINRWKGMGFILVYATYIGYLIQRG
ncbi:Na+/Ca+ antiporter, CaCA family [Candidatus Vecturithrix granuli]|uniref:Na+/Ca+ antiporter, CaCA family n=1 Tax=Vecturithrix granuli TaxID=1499967 RepID=A0A081BU86_VECG1|nr:Na+/Ca+ antiporter, CaCA family [Candidatus Vecturithrix granuli]